MAPVKVYEVGLRDGLQNEAAFVPTPEKLAFVQALADAGLRHIELTSFVSPRWIPQLADHDQVAREAPRREGVTYSALVPNLRGLEGALEAGLPEIAVFMSASESHSRKNINKSVPEALDVLAEVTSAALAQKLRVRGYLSVVFGCPYEGPVAVEKVRELVHALFEMGVYEVSLGDTIGVGHPGQVHTILNALYQSGTRPEGLALHMHDTRGTALANVLAGLEAGIRTFDSAFGGLGGCPYAPGASGNLATEDLVYMLEAMGHTTGVDLARLVDASAHMQELIGRTLPSKVLQAELAVRAKNERRQARSRTG